MVSDCKNNIVNATLLHLKCEKIDNFC